jgi:predicted dehydrogenase
LKYNVLIVGAGRIAAFFDTPTSDNILTHAHAFFDCPQFKIVGFVDVDQNAATKACQIWGGATFETLDQAFNSSEVDVVCAAAPDEFHYSILIDLLDRPIKLIFAEKPLTQTLVQAEEIINLSKIRKIPILVNYTRRFVPEFVDLQSKIRTDVFGSFLTGSGIYGKGILHNGSHLIDLLRYLVGEVRLVQATNFCYDFYKNEPSASATLQINNSALFRLNFVDCSFYSVFEIDLFFEKARIKITESGLNIDVYMVEQNKIFAGYKSLVLTKSIETQQNKALQFAALHILDALNNQAELRCTANDAFFAMKVCLEILDQVKRYGDEKNNFACL